MILIASPSSPAEISSNQVHMFFKHHSASSQEQLLNDVALVGKTLLYVERNHCE